MFWSYRHSRLRRLLISGPAGRGCSTSAPTTSTATATSNPTPRPSYDWWLTVRATTGSSTVPTIPGWARHLPSSPRPVPFGATATTSNSGAWVTGGRIQWRDPDAVVHTIVDTDELTVIGTHNHLNAAAAVALACLAGASPASAGTALRRFEGLEHRMEPCGVVRGVRCINDSKATNVGATLAALKGIESPVWLILGGRDKDSEFERLRPALGNVRGILLTGEASERIAQALDGAVKMIECGDIEHAVDLGLGNASAGEVLLLAPACTSFDQYDSFEHRGHHFKALIAAR